MATKSRKEIIKAFQTHAVDTTGAGASFWGGVLCSILSMNKNVEKMEWEEIKKCAVLGNAVAGFLKETVDYLNAKGGKVGVVTVHLYRCLLYTSGA